MKVKVSVSVVMMFMTLGFGTAFAVPLLPPDRYDKQYDGEVVVHEIPRQNVWKECSKHSVRKVRKDAAGCAYVENGQCIVYLAMRTKRAPLADILRHEIAHCNGWPNHHPS